MEDRRGTPSLIDVIAHDDLIEDDHGGLRALFDSEYLDGSGEWDPEQPYGCASHDFRIIARIDGRIAEHVGWARREVAVGAEAVAIAGIGGVLIADDARGKRLGAGSWSGRRSR